MIRTLTSLTLILAGCVATAQADLITNGDFSANASSYGTFPGYNGGANPSQPTGWNPVTSVTFQGVNGAGSSTSVFGPSSLTGVSDFLFLQNAGATAAAAQSVTFAPNTSYSLTFSAAGRAGQGNESIGVNVNDGSGSVVNISNYGASDAKFNNYVVNFTTGASAGAGSVTFSNAIDPSGDHTLDISNVTLNAMAAPSIVNSGFEGPFLTNAPGGNYHEGVAADGWTKIDGSVPSFGPGIVGNGSDYSNTTAPEGLQAGLLKADGGMSQPIPGFVAGQQYTISLSAEARGCCGGADPVHIIVGGTDLTFGGLSTLTASAGSYTQYTSDVFTAASATELLQLLGTTSTDSATFLDNLKFNLVPVPEPGSLALFGLGAVALGLTYRRRRRS